MFCSILAPLLCWIGQVHRVFDDLKGHKEQRFPLHLHEKDLEEDQCHVVVSRRGRRGAILARSWRWRGSISTRGCRGSICGESWRDHKCSAADTNALNDHPSQHLPMLMKFTSLVLWFYCTRTALLLNQTNKHLSHRHKLTNDGMAIVAKTGDCHPPAIFTDPFSTQNINIVGSRNCIHCAEQEFLQVSAHSLDLAKWAQERKRSINKISAVT